MRIFGFLVLVLCMTAIAEARGRRYYSSGSSGPNAATKIARGLPKHIAKEVNKEDFHQIELRLLEETNKARVRNGCRPLVLDRRLQRTCRYHAIWMTNNRSMVHGSGVAENIAMGQRSVNEVVHSAWMNSSGHRANILNPSHTKAGLSAYRTPNGTIYWCQQFSR